MVGILSEVRAEEIKPLQMVSKAATKNIALQYASEYALVLDNNNYVASFLPDVQRALSTPSFLIVLFVFFCVFLSVCATNSSRKPFSI